MTFGPPPARPQPTTGAVDGFSLVDMLVALVLLSVVMGLMSAFIGQMRTITRLQADVSGQVEVDALTSYLESAIGQALPMSFVSSHPDERISFDGNKSELRFIAIARQGVKAFGLRETRLALEGDGASKTLMQWFSPRRLDADSVAAAATSIELAKDVTSLQFQYLSYDPATLAPVWTDTWLNKSGMPAAVRFTIETRRDERPLSESGYAILKLSAQSGGDHVRS